MPYGPMMQGPGPGPPGPPGPQGPPTSAESGQNALLPKSLFTEGVKPGDTITLKVSAVYGDEVEVQASATSEEPEEESEESEQEEQPMMTADEEIERAAQEV